MRLSTVARQALAEGIGSAGLVAVVVGSGIAAQRLSSDAGLRLLENALVTGAGLAALVLMVGPVSGAHLNPAVTLAVRAFGGVTDRQVWAYVSAQLVGGLLGVVLANLMYELPAVELSTHDRSAGALWLSEVVATFGLVLLVLALARSGAAAARSAPFAVGAYITAAYWWTSSTSFANPMVTVARTLSDTFAGIAPRSAPMFVLMQLAGAAAAVGVARALFPDLPAEQAVVPHEPPGVTTVHHGGSR